MKLIHKDFEAEIELNGSGTARAIKEALPLEGSTQCWQDGVYFEIPVSRELEDGTPVVEAGDVTYWPNGKCFCVFYGQSQPVSAVTIIGKVKNNLEKFADVRDGDNITLDSD
jgi:hypothetical protein